MGNAIKGEPEVSVQAFEDDPNIARHLSLTTLCVELSEQWPGLRFLGFGFYYAWIWLAYDSSVLVPYNSSTTASYFMMYLSSTTALAITLLLAAVFSRTSAWLVSRREFVLAAAAVAGLATFTIPICSIDTHGGALLFIVMSMLTGLGTACVALRLGAIYSTVNARHAIMYTSISFVFAALLYFADLGIPAAFGPLFDAALPIFGALVTISIASDELPFEGRPVAETDNSAAGQLSRSFFLRLFVGVAVLSTIVGLVCGNFTSAQPVLALADTGKITVMGSGIAALVIFLLIGLTPRDIGISGLYYPIILTLVAMLLVSSFFSATIIVGCGVGIAYSCFMLLIWCLLTHIAHSSRLPPVKVFGLGRGASAMGTTVGWLASVLLVGYGESNVNSALTVSVSLVAVFVVVLIATTVFNEQQISKIVHFAQSQDRHLGEVLTVHIPSMGDDGSMEPSEAPQRHRARWRERCDAIARVYGLSPRERDVFLLLAKGNTLDAIAHELNISLNTAKSHTRNVYVKFSVHTRQELLDLVEEERLPED
jgi:DNA-binding CsgD family transcriptional regulator